MGQACISSKVEDTRMREEEETGEEDGTRTNQKKGTKEEVRGQPKEEGKKREGVKRVTYPQNFRYNLSSHAYCFL